MSDLHLEVLRPPQKELLSFFQRESEIIRPFYLAGGTALALQLGHRESQDFDFFSQTQECETVRSWLENLPRSVIRDADAQTVHADIAGVKVSFIGGYKYPPVMPLIPAGSLPMAAITDIALMKMLAITHRATLRDYLDLAVILRDHCSLRTLMEKSTEKYGTAFNAMLSVRTMVHFDDLDEETPVLLDPSLAGSWKDILRKAVKEAAGAL